jgi:hypothetical protein
MGVLVPVKCGRAPENGEEKRRAKMKNWRVLKLFLKRVPKMRVLTINR